MGAAIAGGLSSASDIALTVSNPSTSKLDALKTVHPAVNVTTDNREAAKWGDVVVLAVKPWLMQQVVEEIKPVLQPDRQQLVSIAAGIDTAQINAWLDEITMPVYYIIPNTAIRIGCSMTFVSPSNATESDVEKVVSVFGRLGKVMLVDEKQIPACMALASCGIAYAMRYVRANMLGAVELGLKPVVAQEIVGQTMIGAAQLLAAPDSHPETEIDKVTTPGGLTIKGVNTLEENGFTTAVIKALKASM